MTQWISPFPLLDFTSKCFSKWRPRPCPRSALLPGIICTICIHSLHRRLKVGCRGHGGQAGLKQLLLWERGFNSLSSLFYFRNATQQISPLPSLDFTSKWFSEWRPCPCPIYTIFIHSLHRRLKVGCRGRGEGQASLKQLLLWERGFDPFLCCFILGIGIHEGSYKFIKSTDCRLWLCLRVEKQRKKGMFLCFISGIGIHEGFRFISESLLQGNEGSTHLFPLFPRSVMVIEF